jgi:predicted ATP-dependent protease
VLGGPVSSREGDSDSSSSSNNNGEMQFIPPEKKRELAAAIEKFQPKLEEILNKFPQLRKKAVQRVKELNKEAAKNAIEFLFLPLKTRYEDIPGVVSHLDAVEANAIERSEDIHSENEDEDESLMAVMMKPRNRPVPYERYNINLIVDNNETLSTGAPVIYEENPLYYNLIGRTEHLSQFGAYLTDFSLIKAGSLHRANGGYLVLNARDVLIQPFSWEALKRCLRTGAIKIESLGAEYGFISTVTLQPEPIKLDVKVALVGDRLLYYLLCELDPDFNELFKVAADFNDEMDRSPEACQLFAQMMATLAKEKELKPLDKEAVAAMIEQAARQVGDQEKLSTHMRSCTDLLCESDYWARMDDASVVGSQHVRKAIDQQIYRADRIRALIYEQIRRGIMLVDVKGSHVGQVNGLSVMTLGSLMFGRPSRITATARLGRGKVVDIEREVELGGALHSKGVMILSSFLSSHYALDCPLCVSANLVFEQSYGMIEGDSASMAELCALLSTLADVPVRQDFAITGSVNQFGQAQAIGGVTEKIEGFYDVCVAVGLTGDQAVLVPESNVPHLMLRPDVLEAVDQGKFSVYTYSTVNEAMKLLTGKEAGERGADGSYPPDTINHLVDERLHEFAELTRKFSSEGGSDSEEKINGEA